MGRTPLYRRWWMLIVYSIIGYYITDYMFMGTGEPTTTQQTVNFTCPELSGMKLQTTDNVRWAATADNTNPLVEYPYSDDGTIPCKQDTPNTNLILCGDLGNPITLATADETRKISIEVMFDKNTQQYIKTTCNTYPVY
jgi:hypothetical protein